ncbi:MAG: SDR family oxidoreductase [Deltaproteobacteria bacterium]|nr:SDR family oxidoreductase [Deltaproteobacteria bacterium]
MNIVVTGSSRGIGAAIARRLAAPGRAVLVNYLQGEEAARAVAADVEARGARAVLVQGNVRSEDDLRRIAATFDRVDVLVHNAAIGVLKPFDKIRAAQWDLTLESSLRPFWLLTKLCPLADGAAVIGLSSMGSSRHVPGYAAMGAAKAGMEALTRQLAVELAPRVRVNTVCGGLVRTDALRYFPEGEQMVALASRHTPLGRIAEPDDIASIVELLVDPRSYWINGQVIVADGGLSIR